MVSSHDLLFKWDLLTLQSKPVAPVLCSPVDLYLYKTVLLLQKA